MPPSLTDPLPGAGAGAGAGAGTGAGAVVAAPEATAGALAPEGAAPKSGGRVGERAGERAGDRGLGWVLLVTGLLGAAAAFVLTVERFALAADPTYVPSCSINPVLSCGSVMATAQAQVLGFPNSLLGVAGFPVLAATGAVLLAGGRLARWYWAGLQLGTTAAVVFVHWLAFQSIYRIGALCPYCLVVWAVTITAFWYLTLRTAQAGTARAPARVRSVVAAARAGHTVVLTAWALAFAAVITHRFWSYWSTLL